MSQHKIEQRNSSGRRLLRQLTPLLAVLLLSLLVSSVFAQEGPSEQTIP